MSSIKGKKVLITGAGGFIGSHLVEKLLAEGAQVKALVQYNSLGSWDLLEDIKGIKNNKNLQVVLGDINDPHFCLRLAEDVDIIFHLAALIDIPYSYVAPRSYFETNVLGTINLLEAALRNRVNRFIHTSTSETYGTALYTPMDENHPLQAQSPYAASKVGADKAAMSYFLSFNLPVSIIRPFNNFGPRQSARGVIPTIVTQLLSGNIKEVKLGSLDPIRDYTFVKDTAEGFINVALFDKTIGETMNLGVGKGYSIKEIFNLISNLTQIDKKVVTDAQRIRPRNSEVWQLVCSNEKMKKLIGWTPQTSLEEGLKTTIEWIKENLELYKPEVYSI
ncbi:MAG: SDR family NAD(P)-dependent oxidoreductase [Candidatus Daviesbacteria bacterium]|nr:SDR family NAD(P)-dependent oxidoreductase [Candidatus Daviesbacteria bacterium]